MKIVAVVVQQIDSLLVLHENNKYISFFSEKDNLKAITRLLKLLKGNFLVMALRDLSVSSPWQRTKGLLWFQSVNDECCGHLDHS
jgi:hypothetical protein